MKKIKAFLLIVVISMIALAGSFQDGYRAGYKAGYCYGEQYCMPPMAPLPPMPRLGENSYQGGYNRGFVDGLNSRY
jgi:hypothetical protein